MSAPIASSHKFRGDRCYECDSALADEEFYAWWLKQPENTRRGKAVAQRAWRESRGLVD